MTQGERPTLEGFPGIYCRWSPFSFWFVQRKVGGIIFIYFTIYCTLLVAGFVRNTRTKLIGKRYLRKIGNFHMAMHGIDIVENFGQSLSHHGEHFAVVLF